MFGQDDNLDGVDEELLEDEHLFKTPIVDKEVPELRDDIKIIATIESHLSGIQYLLSDIRQLGGMNQTLALEAANYSDAIKNTNINYFTKEPTQTKLVFSQESLWQSIKDSFYAIYTWIRNKIKSAWAWLVGLFKSDEEVSDKDYEAAKRKVDESERANDKAWEMVTDHLKQVNQEIKVLNKYPEVFKSLVPETEIPDLFNFTTQLLKERPNLPIARLLNNEEPFNHDIVSFGPYIKLIKEITTVLPIAQMQINKKLDTLSTVLLDEARDVHDVSIREGAISDLKEVSKPFLFAIFSRKLNTDDLLNLINNTRGNVLSNRIKEKYSFQDLVTRLYVNESEFVPRYISGRHTKAVKALIDIESKIAKLMKQTYEMEFGEQNSPGNDEIVSSFRNALSKLTSEVTAYTIILRYIKITIDQLYFATRDAVHFSDSILDWVVEHGRREGIDINNDVKKLADTVKSRRNRNYEAYKKYMSTKGL